MRSSGLRLEQEPRSAAAPPRRVPKWQPRREASPTHPFFRQCLHYGLAGLLRVSGVTWWAKRKLRKAGAVSVVTLHRVLPDQEFTQTSSPRGMVIRRRTFDGMASYLAASYEICDAAARFAQPGITRKTQLMITFDDGWVDNLEALTSLRRNWQIPATLFFCTDLAGAREPFWPERLTRLFKSSPAVSRRTLNELGLPIPNHAQYGAPSCDEIDSYIATFKKLDPVLRSVNMRRLAAAIEAAGFEPLAEESDSLLSWGEVETLSRKGVRFGSHTASHAIVTELNEAERKLELARSKCDLERALLQPCDCFSYPNGNHSDDSRRSVEQAGYRYAFTTRSGAWTSETDPLLIPRINLWEGKLVTPLGNFSRIMFDYSVLWPAYRSLRREGGK